MEQTFYEMVYDVVRLIPKGRVTSYGAIAKCLGAGGSARMVGYAMNNAHGMHPPVPAHRVVNRNGYLTGKFHFMPPELMQQMLESEGITVIDDKVQDFKTRNWDPAEEI
ncbi:MAG: Cysteine methyltransferase [Pedobacter sp.]|jgi:methylated-DNA-protein-cysteine methyltransferase-like protein|nr:Cysteine methyltransferase [Pedobacter sp.]